MATHDWLSKVKQTGNLDNLYLRLFLYGKPGTGKTTFAGSAPKPFFLCAEDGMLTLFKSAGIPYYLIDEEEDDNVYKTVRDILHDAKNRTGPFAEGEALADCQTFVIDSLSELSGILLRQIIKSNRRSKAEFDDWGQLANQLATIVNIHKTLPMHCVSISGETARELKYEKEIMPCSSIKGGYRDDVMHAYDFNFWMHKKALGGKVKYQIATDDNRGRAAKGRGIKLDNILSDVDFNFLMDKFKKLKEA